MFITRGFHFRICSFPLFCLGIAPELFLPVMPRQLKIHYQFEVNNRTYEGDYDQESFMQNSLVALRNKYPFLPKDLLQSRAKKIWETEVKKLKKPPKPVFISKKTRSAKIKSIRRLKRASLDLSPDERVDFVHTGPDLFAEPSCSKIDSNSSTIDLISPTNNLSLLVKKPPLQETISSEMLFGDSMIDESNEEFHFNPRKSVEIFESTRKSIDSKTPTKCYISDFIPLNFGNDCELVKDVSEKSQIPLTTTIERVPSPSILSSSTILIDSSPSISSNVLYSECPIKLNFANSDED